MTATQEAAMAATYRARALRYARDILRRLPENANLSNADLNLRAAKRLNGSLLALARVNIRREMARAR